MSDAWQAGLEAIRQRADLVEIIEQTTRLRRAGPSYKGLCPFHEEKTPSFMVTPAKGIYKCFGCGEGGDVFKFVMSTRHLSFREAVEWLAERYSIPMPKSSGSTTAVDQDERRLGLAALRYCAEWYHAVLTRSPKAHTARTYWASRGFSEQTLSLAQVGYSPDASSLPDTLQKRGFSLEIAARYGMVRKGRLGYEDMYFGRLIFPIHDARGDIVGFGARVIPGITPSGSPDAKYLNTPDTDLFHKGTLLYGQHLSNRIRNRDRVILTEGYFDVLRALEHGIAACAPMGTALTEPQALRLRRAYSQVILAFDGDAAGSRAARRSIQMFAQIGMPVHLAALPAGEDVDSFLRVQDVDSLAQWLHSATPGLEAMLDAMVQGRTSLQQRQQAAQEIREYVRDVSDPVLRADIENHVSQTMGVDFALSDLPMREPTPSHGRDIAPQAQPAKPVQLHWSTLLTVHSTTAERRQALLGSDASDWLTEEQLQYVQGLSPLPESMLAVAMSQPELQPHEWQALLSRAESAAGDEHRSSRRERLVGLIEQATTAGDTDRATMLMQELQLLLAASPP